MAGLEIKAAIRRTKIVASRLFPCHQQKSSVVITQSRPKSSFLQAIEYLSGNYFSIILYLSWTTNYTHLSASAIIGTILWCINFISLLGIEAVILSATSKGGAFSEYIAASQSDSCSEMIWIVHTTEEDRHPTGGLRLEGFQCIWKQHQPLRAHNVGLATLNHRDICKSMYKNPDLWLD